MQITSCEITNTKYIQIYVTEEELEMQETKEYKLTEETLTEEIMVALQDVFVAKIERKGNCIFMQFLDGKKFKVSIQEERM